MKYESPILLLGIGTSGAAMARNVRHAFGEDIPRCLLIDTDATTGQPDETFLLFGGNRLSGRGAGGDIVAARQAAEDSLHLLDEHLEDIVLAIVVTGLGGGTGGGATLEILNYLGSRNIHTIVFATLPFAFEGGDRQRSARGILPMIEDAANATFVLPLDKLVKGEDNMTQALQRGLDTVASGVALFWRLLERPGYIKTDVERIRQIIGHAGNGRFAVVTAQGSDRAAVALDQLIHSEMLSLASSPVRAIFCGILAGEDLRLSEVGVVANGIRRAFGERLTFNLGTVNDEQTFCGRMSVVVMLFESGEKATTRPKSRSNLNPGPRDRGRFNQAEPTVINGEDLDMPTYIRKGVNLDF